jgi:hypothetical protein
VRQTEARGFRGGLITNMAAFNFRAASSTAAGLDGAYELVQ